MDDESFGKIINKAVGELPKEIRKKMENVAIVIADFPTPLQMEMVYRRGEGGLLLGLYEGVPATKRGSYGIGPTIPDKITIFKKPLMLISGSIENAVENIKETVIHEIAHHFGLNDDDIYRIRNKT